MCVCVCVCEYVCVCACVCVCVCVCTFVCVCVCVCVYVHVNSCVCPCVHVHMYVQVRKSMAVVVQKDLPYARCGVRSMQKTQGLTGIVLDIDEVGGTSASSGCGHSAIGRESHKKNDKWIMHCPETT